MDDPTLFQRLIHEEAVSGMIDDLSDLEGLIPEEEDYEDMQGFEIAVSFTAEDVPYILEELREMEDDGG